MCPPRPHFSKAKRHDLMGYNANSNAGSSTGPSRINKARIANGMCLLLKYLTLGSLPTTAMGGLLLMLSTYVAKRMYKMSASS